MQYLLIDVLICVFNISVFVFRQMDMKGSFICWNISTKLRLNVCNTFNFRFIFTIQRPMEYVTSQPIQVHKLIQSLFLQIEVVAWLINEKTGVTAAGTMKIVFGHLKPRKTVSGTSFKHLAPGSYKAFQIVQFFFYAILQRLKEFYDALLQMFICLDTKNKTAHQVKFYLFKVNNRNTRNMVHYNV